MNRIVLGPRSGGGGVIKPRNQKNTGLQEKFGGMVTWQCSSISHSLRWWIEVLSITWPYLLLQCYAEFEVTNGARWVLYSTNVARWGNDMNNRETNSDCPLATGAIPFIFWSIVIVTIALVHHDADESAQNALVADDHYYIRVHSSTYKPLDVRITWDDKDKK